MDAELKQAFDSLSGKIDDIKKSLEKVETAHQEDHDALIRLEGKLESEINNFNRQCEAEKTYGKQMSDRIDAIDAKINKMSIIVAVIGAGVGGGIGQLLEFLK